MRMPNSEVRWLTADESTPKIPITARPAATPANTANSIVWNRRNATDALTISSSVRTLKGHLRHRQ